MDYLCLVTKFDGKTIKLPFYLMPFNASVKMQGEGYRLILDTGADHTALTEDFLQRNGYIQFHPSGIIKRTATGEAELLTCNINGLVIANQFKVGSIKVDVLSGWNEHAVVGIIGMDILSRFTFILSHEHKKFLLSAQNLPEPASLFV